MIINNITKINNFNNNNVVKTFNYYKRHYTHPSGCFNIERIQKMEENSSFSNPYLKKSFKGPLSIKDLQFFDENGYLVKSGIIDNKYLNDFQNEFNNYQQNNISNIINNIQYNCHLKSLYEIRQDQNFYESYIQLLGSTYSDAYNNYSNTLSLINTSKSTLIKNVSFLEYPNFIHNFSPIELFMFLGNSVNKIQNDINNNNDKLINLDCNPFNLFKNESIDNDGIVYSNIEYWKPISSIISLKDNQEISVIPKFHKKSIKFIQDKYLEKRLKTVKNLSNISGSGSIKNYDSSNFYKNDTELISNLKSIQLNKGDIVYLDWRLPKSIESLSSYIDVSFLPNVLINQLYISIQKNENYKNGIISLNNNNYNKNNQNNNDSNQSFFSKLFSIQNSNNNINNNSTSKIIIKEYNNQNYNPPKLSLLGDKLLNINKW